MQRQQEIVGRRGQNRIKFRFHFADHRPTIHDALHERNRASFMDLGIRLPAIPEENLSMDEVSQCLNKGVNTRIDRKLGSRVFYEKINRCRQLPNIWSLIVWGNLTHTTASRFSVSAPAGSSTICEFLEAKSTYQN